MKLPQRSVVTTSDCVVSYVISGDVVVCMQAVEDMNGKLVNGRSVYVNRAQKKKERQMELHRKYEAEKMERYNRYDVIL